MSTIPRDPFAPLSVLCKDGQPFNYCFMRDHAKDKKGCSGVLDIKLMQSMARIYFKQIQVAAYDGETKTVISVFYPKEARSDEDFDRHAASVAAVFTFFANTLRIGTEGHETHRMCLGEPPEDRFTCIAHTAFCATKRWPMSLFVKWEPNNPFLQPPTIPPIIAEPWGIDRLNIKRLKGEGDCILSFGEHSFSAHCLILQQFSPFLETMISSRMKESESKIFELREIPAFDRKTLEALMTFIYLKKLDLTQFPLSTSIKFLELGLFLSSSALQNQAFAYILKRGAHLSNGDILHLHLIQMLHPEFKHLCSFCEWLLTARPHFFAELLEEKEVSGETLFNMLVYSKDSSDPGIITLWKNLPTQEKVVLIKKCSEAKNLELLKAAETLYRSTLDSSSPQDTNLLQMQSAFKRLKTTE